MTIAERLQMQHEIVLQARDALYTFEHVNELWRDKHLELEDACSSEAAWIERAAARAPMNSTLHQQSIADEAYWRVMRIVCNLRIARADEQHFNQQARNEYGEIAARLLSTTPLAKENV